MAYKRNMRRLSVADQNMLKYKTLNAVKRFETILIGDAYCGKTTYLKKLIDNEYDSEKPSVVSEDGNEFEFCFEADDKKAIFLVKDTANQEKFRSLTQTHYRKAERILLMFDPNNADSFEHLVNWYRDIENYCNNLNTLKIVLVALIRKGDNRDMREQVSEALINDFQMEHETICGYCSIDLNSGDNFKEPFEIFMRSTSDQDLFSGRKSTISLRDKNYFKLSELADINEDDKPENGLNSENKCCLIS